MPFSQSDRYRLAATWSCSSRFSKSQASNTYQDRNGTNLLGKLNSDHWRFSEKVPRRRSKGKVDSLGSPVGLVCSNATMGNCMQKAEATARNFATYLKAFALIYILPEVDWTAEKIDMLLEQGLQLYRCSSQTNRSKDEDRRENQTTGIYTNEEKRIKRNFILEGHTFTMALEPRYIDEGNKPHIIKNLRSVLQTFFKSRRYGLLLTRVGHLLIWRRRKVFFVLDIKGRRRDDLQSDKDNGVAMLVCLKTIDNVVYLASNLSGITPKDAFSIRELVVVRLKTPDGRIFMRDSSYRAIEFKVVNKSYAYLKASLHLSLGHNGTMKNRSSLVVAVCSILASKIDHPANWDTNMLDRLICYGVELCCSCIKEQRPIELDTFPTQLRLGQFVVELNLKPRVRLGYWQCLDSVTTDFEATFKETLRMFGNAVFHINNQIYAMWAKNDFYYLLDPYRHTIVGTHVEEDQCKGSKWATLRMFRDPLTMLSVFHQLLQQSNGRSAYSLHAVRIRNILECHQDFVPFPLPKEVDTCDVESLNEPIMFSDELGAAVQKHCLAVISDSGGESEYDLDIDQEELQMTNERRCEGTAEDIMLESPTRSCSSLSQKSIILTPVATKSNFKSRKNTKRSNNNYTTGEQSLEKKRNRKYKEVKRSEVSIEESKPRSPRKPVKLSKKSPTKYETETFKRQRGGVRDSDNSANIFKTESCSGNDKWCANESAVIRLGTKVAASSLLTQGDVCRVASSQSLLTSKRHSIPEDASITNLETTSLENSYTLNLAPKPKSKSVPLGTGHQAEPAPRQKPTELDNTKLRAAGGCSLPEVSESRPRYPGYNREPQLLAVAGSESGTVESLNRLLGSAFKVANRVLTMTPWGNYVVFRHSPDSGKGAGSTWFFLFDGCTCNIDRFRHLDLSIGTAGLLAFRKLSEVVCHMINSREKRAQNVRQSQENDKDCDQH